MDANAADLTVTAWAAILVSCGIAGLQPVLTGQALPSVGAALARGTPVYVIVWAFRPRPGREVEFERAYGPRGSWVTLFREAPGYLGTELLRAADGSGRYLTVDRWESQGVYEAFRVARRAEYEALDHACETLTASEERVGDFVRIESLSNESLRPTGLVEGCNESDT
jgi:heme-degrading monooxygenase HmoA